MPTSYPSSLTEMMAAIQLQPEHPSGVLSCLRCADNPRRGVFRHTDCLPKTSTDSVNYTAAADIRARSSQDAYQSPACLQSRDLAALLIVDASAELHLSLSRFSSLVLQSAGSTASSPAQPLEGKPSSEASEDWVQLRNPDGRIFHHNPATGAVSVHCSLLVAASYHLAVKGPATAVCCLMSDMTA